MQYDIFLSYRRSTGADVARMMALALTARGYRVYFDYGSTREGAASQEVFSAIESADVFMLMMTEGALDVGDVATEWVRTELFFALSKKKHVVPVGPTNQKWGFPADLPESIAGVANLQVSRLDMESLFEESIDKIERERFTEEFRSRRKRRNVVLSNLGAGDRGFIGRESELLQLRETLFSGRIAVVAGENGIGKSAVVRRYAQISEQDYPGGVFLINCGQSSSWEDLFASLGGDKLSDGKTFIEHFNLDAQASGASVRNALLRESVEKGALLLVLEDVQSVDTMFAVGIYSAFPDGLVDRARVEIVATTQTKPACEIAGLREIPLERLTTESALALMFRSHPAADEGDRAAAEDVAKLLDCCPDLLRRVPKLIGDEFAEVMCDSYAELADLLREDFDGTLAAVR